MKTKILAVIAASTLGTTAAFAQTAEAPAAAPQMTMEQAYSAARNQLGVLEYCQAGGHIESNVIDIQNKMVSMIPAPDDTAEAEAAYAKGKEGTISAMGTEQSLEQVASAQSTTEASLCEQMGQLVAQAGSQLPPG